MKTATLPSLRVDPKLRDAAEKVLENGETLSAFVEASVRDNIRRRTLQKEFIARGLRARDHAEQTGEYYTSDEVMAELDGIVDRAERSG